MVDNLVNMTTEQSHEDMVGITMPNETDLNDNDSCATREDTQIPEEGKSENGQDNSPNTPEDNLNKLFVDIGGVGWFQKLAYFVICAGLNSTGFWAYPLGYYTQRPKYNCEFDSSVNPADYEAVCRAKNICKNDERITGYSVDWSNDKSLENW